MAAKAILLVCAQVLLLKGALSQCAGGLVGPHGLGYNGLAGYGGGLAGGFGAGLAHGYGAGCGAGVASTGGGLPVSSASPIAPVGVSVHSENAYEGQLCAGGNLPFLGSVGIEGVLPTGGAGAVSYGCGDGAIGIGSEGPIATGIAAPGAVFPPGSPNSAATADALALAGNNGLGYNGLGGVANGLGGIGYNGLRAGAYNGIGAGCAGAHI